MSWPVCAGPKLHNGSHPFYAFPLWNEITVLKVLCAFTEIHKRTKLIRERVECLVSCAEMEKGAVTLTVVE